MPCWWSTPWTCCTAPALPPVVAIASSDADFAPLALRLREEGTWVICFAHAAKSADSDLSRCYDELVYVDPAEAAARTRRRLRLRARRRAQAGPRRGGTAAGARVRRPGAAAAGIDRRLSPWTLGGTQRRGEETARCQAAGAQCRAAPTSCEERRIRGAGARLAAEQGAPERARGLMEVRWGEPLVRALARTRRGDRAVGRRQHPAAPGPERGRTLTGALRRAGAAAARNRLRAVHLRHRTVPGAPRPARLLQRPGLAAVSPHPRRR